MEEQIIEELWKVNVEHLTPEAFRLFNVIIKIIDERDIIRTELNARDKELRKLINELSYNKNVNKEKDLENRVDIDYILERLKEL